MISLYAESADIEIIRPYLKDIKYIVEDCYGYLNLDTIFVNLVLVYIAAIIESGS